MEVFILVCRFYFINQALYERNKRLELILSDVMCKHLNAQDKCDTLIGHLSIKYDNANQLFLI